MASVGLPAIVHLIPVISSTCSLWFAWDQYEFLMVFCKPELRSLSNKLLTPYFTTFFNRGAPRVVALLATTALSCGYILRYSPCAILGDSASWYIAGKPAQNAEWISNNNLMPIGLSFALGHLVWAPVILPSIRAIQGDAKENNVAELQNWLRIHAWRSLTVDIAAWVCCIVATTKCLDRY
ncbi:putative integral membrane protein [Hypomontagnella monticulosa]|nr:putative integral membrane protein [Hypomontagnella monticulosa]